MPLQLLNGKLLGRTNGLILRTDNTCCCSCVLCTEETKDIDCELTCPPGTPLVCQESVYAVVPRADSEDPEKKKCCVCPGCCCLKGAPHPEILDPETCAKKGGKWVIAEPGTGRGITCEDEEFDWANHCPGCCCVDGAPDDSAFKDTCLDNCGKWLETPCPNPVPQDLSYWAEACPRIIGGCCIDGEPSDIECKYACEEEEGVFQPSPNPNGRVITAENVICTPVSCCFTQEAVCRTCFYSFNLDAGAYALGYQETTDGNCDPFLTSSSGEPACPECPLWMINETDVPSSLLVVEVTGTATLTVRSMCGATYCSEGGIVGGVASPLGADDYDLKDNCTDENIPSIFPTASGASWSNPARGGHIAQFNTVNCDEVDCGNPLP